MMLIFVLVATSSAYHPILPNQYYRHSSTDVPLLRRSTPSLRRQSTPPTASQSTPTLKTVDTAHPPVPSLRECFRFVLPAFGIYASPALMSLIDAAFVGRLSTLELAALGPASSISDSAPNPLLFISIGATNLCARAFATKGSGDALATTTRTSLVMGVAGGFIIAGLVTANAASLAMAYCSGNAALAVPCARYVFIRALAIPAVVIATVAQAICIGVKDTTTPLIAVGLSAALNLGGNFVLINGLGQGLAGAAWATSASQLCAAALLLQVRWLSRRRALIASDDL